MQISQCWLLHDLCEVIFLILSLFFVFELYESHQNYVTHPRQYPLGGIKQI